MLGIDIVDLEDPKLRERDDRSLDLIRNKEDILIDHPNQFWLLWSAKEAIFKCKREPINYSPSKIPIKLKKEDDHITFESDGIKGEIHDAKDYILAICGDLDKIDYQIFTKKNSNWSEGIRFMVIDFFREKGLDYHIGSDDLNLPVIEPARELISITHHGRYGAVAFPKNILS
ncbi:MAG: 4'-phosphopantetheinyl transferase superfamily protein [Ekhidna sp.]|uniref:4'-phosphopantetheinyl transferase family protein n=1 Tax=Ekhidna sp. TaxID=2608089 RepID=UPI0032EADEC4